MGDPIDSGEIATRESANVSDFVEACAGNGQSEFSVFKPYREIGCYSSNAPIYALSRGSRSLLACPIGDSFQILEGDTLRVILISTRLEAEIISLIVADEDAFAVTSDSLHLFRRGKECLKVEIRENDGGQCHVHGISMLGALLALFCEDNKIRFYSRDDLSLIETLEVEAGSTITALLQPSTYLNKLLVARDDGSVSLWNVRRKQHVYSLKSPLESAISVAMQSPALDVIAFGTLSGLISLHNIKTDTRVLTLRQDNKVTCISFRQDCSNVMATAGIDGNIRIWDLRDARLLHLIEDAHAAEVHTLHFCYNQPVLVSSGADNCIKQWIFDNPDNSPRILRQRYGHSRTPNKIRFYGEDPFSIISVSPDRSVRIFSTLKLTRGAELSQGNIESSSNRCNTPAQNLKLPPAIHLDSSGQKHNNWDDIVTCHLGESCARTWSFENKTLGPHVLPSLDKSEVICASLSSCGNFATIGSKNGGVYRYNIQSGAHRATYKDCASAHTLAVTGISSDSINKKLITSSSDKTIKFWDFNSRELLKRLKFNDAVVLLSFNRGSNFAVASFSNLVMRVIDIETYNTVRIFSGHRNRIMDICFSPDSRFIATCSLDSTIRLWDVATGHSVDILETPSIPISIAFSPNGDFLASTHLDGNGIFLWSNTIFYKSFSLSTTRDDRLHKSRWILPKSSGTTIKRSSPAHDRNRRITLSNQPHSRCNSLINIEVIMKRNKPIQPKEDPKLPPFFLTLASENVPVKLSEGNVKLKGAPRASRILKFNEVQSDFVKELISAYTTNNYSSFIDYIETLPVVTLASEIQLIGINTNSDIIPAFIIAMTRSIGSSKKNYNTVQAYLHMFIRQNYESILQHPRSEVLLKDLLAVHQSSWRTLESLFKYILAMTEFVRL